MFYVQLIYPYNHIKYVIQIYQFYKKTHNLISQAILVCVTLVIGTALGDFQCTKNSCQNPYSCAMEREILFLIFFFFFVLLCKSQEANSYYYI